MGRPIGTNIILEDCGTYLKIDVSTKSFTGFMLIDKEDYYEISENPGYGRMGMNRLGYVAFKDFSDSPETGHQVHRFVTKFEYKVTDHINQVTYDNRRCNLRDGSNNINSRNTKLFSSNKSGFRGVLCIKDDKFHARIGGKQFPTGYLHLGTFETFEEAVGARLAAEIKYEGQTREDLKES